MAKRKPKRSTPSEQWPRPLVENNPNPVEEQPEAPEPALGAPGRHVVQVNVEEDMPMDGETQPVNEAATDRYHLYRPRTIAMVVVAVLVALLLALPVVWGLVELVVLAGVVGPLIWAWVALIVGLIVAAVVIGYRIAQAQL